MTTYALKFISDAMESAGIPYEFMEYTSAIDSISSYWVGEYTETPTRNESGEQETQFILTGTGKDKWSPLEKEKEKIRELFPDNQGRTAILPNGNVVAVFYSNAFPVPTGDAFLKRLQVNLTVKEWRK